MTVSDLQLDTTSAQKLEFLIPESRHVKLKNLRASSGSCLVRQELTAAGKSSEPTTIDLAIVFTDESRMVTFALSKFHKHKN